MSGRYALIACVGVLAVLVAACGGSGGGGRTTSASQPQAGACRLPGAQVSDIVGFAVKNGVGTQGEQDCFYSTMDESRSLVVSVREIPGGEAKVVANLKKEFADVTAMSGTTDAYSIPHLSEVVLFAGHRQIIVLCHHLDATKELAVARAVAG